MSWIAYVKQSRNSVFCFDLEWGYIAQFAGQAVVSGTKCGRHFLARFLKPSPFLQMGSLLIVTEILIALGLYKSLL